METFSIEEEDQALEESSFQQPSAEASSSLPSKVKYDPFGDPAMVVNIGDQYQTEIPPLISEFGNSVVQHYATGLQLPADTYLSDHVELAIPIKWVSSLGDCIRPKPLYHGDTIPMKTDDFSFSTTKAHHESIPGEIVNNFGGGQRMSEWHKSNDISQKHGNFEGQFFPAPGQPSKSWTKHEQDFFLICLYVFGRNFALIKQFVGSKAMPDILFFYYGSFYGSSLYKSFKKFQKWRGTKSNNEEIIVHPFMSGLIQQELISRLVAQVPENVGKSLLEVSEMYSQKKLLVENFIARLIDMVGLPLLFDAFAFGRRKLDLTRMPVQYTKINPPESTCPDIPVGKDCSALSTEDIIKYLTGDFRMSKAKAFDIFWGAIWPRLLERGWQSLSEEPKKPAYVNPRHIPYIFLVPGVKKFSRRKLTKGTHYYDSLTDVLNKVAADPELLELESEAKISGKCTIDGIEEDTHVIKEKMQLLNNGHHHYLQPRTSNINEDVLKFTVVDTSLVTGEPRKVRELRSLPSNKINAICHVRTSRPTDNDSSPEPIKELVEFSDQEEQIIEDKGKTKSNTGIIFDDLSNEGNMAASPLMLSPKNGSNGMQDVIRYLTPITKRRRLNACDRLDRSRNEGEPSQVKREEEDDDGSVVGFYEDNKMVIASENETFHQKISSPPSSEDSIIRVDYKFEETELLDVKSEPVELIDLNFPHFPTDFSTVGAFIPEMDDGKDMNITKDVGIRLETHLLFHKSEAVCESIDAGSTDFSSVNSRRVSTRSRPLTTKALEAIESGFLSANKGIREKRGNSSRRSKRRASKTSHSEKIDGIVVDANLGRTAGEHNSYTSNDFSEPQDPSEENPEHELFDE